MSRFSTGSIDNIPTGGQPKELMVEGRQTRPNPLSSTGTEDVSLAPTEELLRELRRRIVSPRDTWDEESETLARALA